MVMCLRCWWSLALVADASVSRGRSSDGRLPAGINIFPTTSGAQYAAADDRFTMLHGPREEISHSFSRQGPKDHGQSFSSALSNSIDFMERGELESSGDSLNQNDNDWKEHASVFVPFPDLGKDGKGYTNRCSGGEEDFAPDNERISRSNLMTAMNMYEGDVQRVLGLDDGVERPVPSYKRRGVVILDWDDTMYPTTKFYHPQMGLENLFCMQEGNQCKRKFRCRHKRRFYAWKLPMRNRQHVKSESWPGCQSVDLDNDDGSDSGKHFESLRDVQKKLVFEEGDVMFGVGRTVSRDGSGSFTLETKPRADTDTFLESDTMSSPIPSGPPILCNSCKTHLSRQAHSELLDHARALYKFLAACEKHNVLVLLTTFSYHFEADIDFLFHGLHADLHNKLMFLSQSQRSIRAENPAGNKHDPMKVSEHVYVRAKQDAVEQLLIRNNVMLESGEVDESRFMFLNIGDGNFERLSAKKLIRRHRLRGASFTITPFPLAPTLATVSNQWLSLERALPTVLDHLDREIKPVWLDYMMFPASMTKRSREDLALMRAGQPPRSFATVTSLLWRRNWCFLSAVFALAVMGVAAFLVTILD